MRAAPVLIGLSILVFAAMLALMGPTEAASMVLFPLGALLAVAGLAVGTYNAFRGTGRMRVANAVAAGVGFVVVALAAIAFTFFLWVMGVFGNAWGS